MQPLFAHTPLTLGAWVAGLLIWRVLEAGLDIRTHQRLRAGLQRQDKGSHLALLCLIVGGIFIGILLALKVPTTAVTGAPSPSRSPRRRAPNVGGSGQTW